MPITTSTVKYEKRDRVAWITLNRPEAMNALNSEIQRGIIEDHAIGRLVYFLPAMSPSARELFLDLADVNAESLGALQKLIHFPLRNRKFFVEVHIFKKLKLNIAELATRLNPLWTGSP